MKTRMTNENENEIDTDAAAAAGAAAAAASAAASDANRINQSLYNRKFVYQTAWGKIKTYKSLKNHERVGWLLAPFETGPWPVGGLS